MTQPRKWTNDEDTILRFMYAEGQPVRSIGERLGRSEAAVIHRATWLGIAHPGKDRSAAEERAYQAILDAAKEGLPCPTNKALAAIIGIKSIGATAGYVRRLEDQGRFVVERSNSGRTVTFPELGIETKPPPDRNPHWRVRTAEDKENAARRQRIMKVAENRRRRAKRAAARTQEPSQPKKPAPTTPPKPKREPPCLLAVLLRMPASRGEYQPKTCQWIDGEPTANAKKCGKPVLGNLSYCQGHAERCYTPVEGYRSRAA